MRRIVGILIMMITPANTETHDHRSMATSKIICFCILGIFILFILLTFNNDIAMLDTLWNRKIIFA